MMRPKTAGELEALPEMEDYELDPDVDLEWMRIRQELQDIAREHEPLESDKQRIADEQHGL